MQWRLKTNLCEKVPCIHLARLENARKEHVLIKFHLTVEAFHIFLISSLLSDTDIVEKIKPNPLTWSAKSYVFHLQDSKTFQIGKHSIR